jgi:hypothetical protein
LVTNERNAYLIANVRRGGASCSLNFGVNLTLCGERQADRTGSEDRNAANRMHGGRSQNQSNDFKQRWEGWDGDVMEDAGRRKDG